MAQNLAATVQSSAKRLFPGLSEEQAFAELLLERAQRNLIKYQAMAHRFEARYGQNFEQFRQKAVESDSKMSNIAKKRRWR